MSERTALNDVAAQAGAVFMEEAGWLIPAQFGDAAADYRQARERAAMFDMSHAGKIEVTGSEAGSFLHNLSTNDVTGLAIGAGCEAFLCTAKAKVVAHLLIYHLVLGDGREGYWLDVAPGEPEKVIKHLDHFVISEQVEFADRTRQFAQLHLAGPQAKAVLEKALLDDVPELAELQHMMRTFGSAGACHVRRHDALGVPGYDIVCLENRAAGVWQILSRSGAKPAGRSAYEALRIEAGTPWYGRDIDENTLAPEVARNEQAICYSKGCFLGQEPIVRVRDIGQVNRMLTGLSIDGMAAVPRGAKLFREGKEVGFVTSSALSPETGKVVALGYVRRGHTTPGTPLEVEAGGNRVAAYPVSVAALNTTTTMASH
jgi:folate-binding protein YgfZ